MKNDCYRLGVPAPVVRAPDPHHNIEAMLSMSVPPRDDRRLHRYFARLQVGLLYKEVQCAGVDFFRREFPCVGSALLPAFFFSPRLERTLYSLPIHAITQHFSSVVV